MWLVCLLLSAFAAEPIPDVVRALDGATAVNWTRLRLEVTDGARDPSVGLDTRPLEQRTIKRLEERLPAAIALVPVRPGETAGQLEAIDAAKAALSMRVTESRYYTSGRVEVVGAVELQEKLAAWSAGRAIVRPGSTSSSGPTGVLIDARGLPLALSYAPEIRDPEGEVLFDATMWRHEAYDHPPVVWVSDAAAPEAAAAGAAPELFVASGANAGAVVLSKEDAARFRAQVAPGDAARTGHVVIVVDAGP